MFTIDGHDRGRLVLSDQDSESWFDGLVNLQSTILRANLLTRVPSLKNMRSLMDIDLADNKITRIAPGNVEMLLYTL